jgi:ribosomal protein S12 methylthiotransferase
MKRKKHPITVGFVALGCAKNTIDSERMLAQIVKAGFLISADPDNTHVLVINTCGFIEPAIAESMETIQRAITYKHRGQIRHIIVTGCLSQRMGQQLLHACKGIDAVVGLSHRDRIAHIIRQTTKTQKRTVYLDSSDPLEAPNISNDSTRIRIGPAHWAYLRISEGCNHRCSFCTIPAIRGPFRSKPSGQILEEAQELVDSGAVELNIIGQDITGYARDRQKDGLASLLQQLDQLNGLAWIRLLYLYPAGISERLIETITASRHIVHYLDIPIQHADSRVLKAMHRPDTYEGLSQLMQTIRETIHDALLRTTVMVGFPGETDRAFERLLTFIKWAQFDALGCFIFSPEPGTPAADLPGQIPLALKQDRLDQVMRLQQEIAFSKNKARVGEQLTCLIDSTHPDGTSIGRFYGQAPEIDGICIIQGTHADPGEMIPVKVTGFEGYDLLVEYSNDVL